MDHISWHFIHSHFDALYRSLENDVAECHEVDPEGEPEVVVEEEAAETQGKHLSILHPIFGNLSMFNIDYCYYYICISCILVNRDVSSYLLHFPSSMNCDMIFLDALSWMGRCLGVCHEFA